MNLRLASVTAAILLASACEDKARFPDHGLKSVEIRMDDAHLGEMLGGGGQHIKYPGTVWIDGRSHPAKISAAGATSIQETKKSFNVKFLDGFTIDGSDDIRLATTIKDRTMIRTLLGFEVFAAAGLPSSRVEPVFVYLNSLVMGLYIRTEKVNEDYFRARGHTIDRMYSSDGEADFAPDFGSRLRVTMQIEAGPDDYEPILAVAKTIEIADDSRFETEVFRRIDRDSLVRYLAAARILNHWDGFNKNLYWYSREGDPRLRFAPWDLDNIFILGWNSNPDVWSPNHLFRRLGNLPSVRSEVDTLVDELLAGPVSKAHLLARVEEWRAKLAGAYAHDPFLGAGRFDFVEQVTDLSQEIDVWLDRL